MQGSLYLKTMLLRIETQKKLFLTEIEQGSETLIPPDLSQDKLPMSYRFYD
jgi:hypothetical protein